MPREQDRIAAVEFMVAGDFTAAGFTVGLAGFTEDLLGFPTAGFTPANFMLTDFPTANFTLMGFTGSGSIIMASAAA